MSQSQALESAKRLTDFLRQREDETESQNLQLEHVGLVRLGSDTSWWGYQFIYTTRRPRLSLMDGSLAIDPDEHGPKLVKAMQAFDSEKELELVDSMFE